MMMHALFFLPIVLSLLVLAAHFLRYGQELGVIGSLLLIGLLFIRRAWAARLIQVALGLGTIEWAHTLFELVQVRVALGAPVVRMVVILGLVIAVTAVSVVLFQTNTLKRIYGLNCEDQPAD